MKKRLFFLLAMAALLSVCFAACAETCIVASTKPAGYCYLYDRPSSSKGTNLGDYQNGAWVEVLDWEADDNFAYVMTFDDQVGYMRKTSLVSVEECYDCCFVNSIEPYGYCYLYDLPSSSNGRNMGRYDNNTWVVVLDWYADDHYAKVYTGDNQTGYMRKTSLAFSWEEPVSSDDYGETYYVANTPKGYCYLYDKPTSRNSTNLGRYNDGAEITVLDENADEDYAYVRTFKGDVGYIRKAYLSK